MKVLFKILMIIFGSISIAQAGDKIGNGGGLWVCAEGFTIKESFLVDFYEAKEEFGFEIISATSSDPFVLFNERANFLQTNLGDLYKQLSPHIATVLTNIKYTNAFLEVVDDALYRISPLPQTCAGGKWEYVQFANYTLLNTLLIRKDLWEHPLISALDKSALLWHEVVYRWLRVEHKDINSIRARQIVGIIYSQFSTEKMKAQIEEVLNDSGSNPPPPPPPADSSWICISMNSQTNQFYSGYASTVQEARTMAVKKCGQAGFSLACNPFEIYCDEILSQALAYTCKIDGDNFTPVNYSGQGRSKVEAIYKVVNACYSGGNNFSICGYTKAKCTP